MPEERQAPVIPNINLEAEPLKLGIQAIEDAYALSTVRETFWAYEQYRAQNHDNRWNAHDSLYVGYLPPRNWEGTNTPRASLGMPITFSQVESAFPAIYQALFLEDSWFQVNPEVGVDPKEAKDVQAHLKYALVHPRADYTGNAEIELELAIKQILLHGNGGVAIEWDAEAGHPRIEWVDLRDFYVDPGSPVPSIDASRSIIRRKLMTIDEIEDLRADPRMKIPERAVLVHMARNSNYVYADRTKQTAEALRGVNYNPAQHEWSPVPAERKIEVLLYYSRHRIIWTFNREWVAYNEKNPYGFVPFCFAPCWPVPGRFYAMSYADVAENPQRYIEALYNSRLDGLALALRPPRVRKRGQILTPSQQRWAPGAVQEAEDPSKDVAILSPGGDTSGIMGDIAYLEAAIEKLLGVGTGLGPARPGNANRTATGMNIQAHSSASRIWPIIKHIEDYLIIPMLYKMYKMVQVHSYQGQQLPGLRDGAEYSPVAAESFRQPCRFSMLASSKMLTREKLSQIVPFLAQFMLNGNFVQGIQGVGQTVDFEVFSQMLQDATGTGAAYKLIRPMNEQEVKAKQTPPPQAMMEAQKAQAEHQVRLQIMDKKVQGELQKEQIKKQPDPTQAQMEQMKMLMSLHTEREKMKMEQEKMFQKLNADHLSSQQKLQNERQAAQQKLLIDTAMNRQKLVQQQQQHTQDLTVQQIQAAQQIRQGDESGRQKLEQTKAMGQHKMSLDKEKLRMQARAAANKPKPKPAPKKKA